MVVNSLSASNISSLLTSLSGALGSEGETPASILGDDLAAWYDPSDASTLTMSGSNVTQLDDKSGNDYNLTTTGVGPTVASINSLDSLDWAVNGDYLENEALGQAVFQGIDKTFTVFIVLQYASNDAVCPWSAGNFSTNAYYACRIQTSKVRMIGFDGSSSRIVDAADTALNKPQVYSFQHNGDSIDSFQNSYRVLNNQSFAMNDVNSDTFALGTLPFNGDPTILDYTGQMGEVVVMDGTPTQAQMNSMQNYLQAKWADAKVVDLVAITGQSNAFGSAEEVGGYTISDKAYIFDASDNSVVAHHEPFGGESSVLFQASAQGSGWGKFADKWHALTGRDVMFISLAKGGAIVGATSGNSWNVGGGNLYPAAKTALDTALRSEKIAFDYLGGWYWLLALGESDGTNITNSVYTSLTYTTALASLTTQIDTDYPFTTICNLRTGTQRTGDTTGLQAVRDGQDLIFAAIPNGISAYENTVNFPGLGFMNTSDVIHYNQVGHNTMCEDSVQNILDGGL